MVRSGDKRLSLEALEHRMRADDLPLKAEAKNLVFGAANPQADVFFIGEAPGRNEDLKGLPFIGSAGKVLDQLLMSIGLDRQDVFITSILKYRPPGNRNPSALEIRAHTPYLVEQVRIIAPKVIVPLGNFACRFVLNGFNTEGMQSIEGVSKIHGKVEHLDFERYNFIVMPLYHPAAVLYNPSLRATLQDDFLKLGDILKNKSLI